MRMRALVAIVILLVPAALSAQRIPLPIGRRPVRGEPLPPTAGPIAKEEAYRRWRLSVESYPMVSWFQTSAFGSWASLGGGTRADYLLNRHMSATLDLTSSMIGSPSAVNTAELGTRLHPEWAEHRLYPYADLRVAYIALFTQAPSMKARPDSPVKIPPPRWIVTGAQAHLIVPQPRKRLPVGKKKRTPS